jgi:hypothetical protein
MAFCAAQLAVLNENGRSRHSIDRLQCKCWATPVGDNGTCGECADEYVAPPTIWRHDPAFENTAIYARLAHGRDTDAGAVFL